MLVSIIIVDYKKPSINWALISSSLLSFSKSIEKFFSVWKNLVIQGEACCKKKSKELIT